MLDRFRASIKSVGDAAKTTSANTRSHLEEVDAGVTQWAHEQATSVENWVVVQTIHAAANFTGIVQAVIVQIGSVIAEIGARIDEVVWGIEDRVRGLIAEVTSFFTGLLDDISARLNTLTASLSKLWDDIVALMDEAIDTAILEMRKYVDGLFAEWSELLNGLDNIKESLFEFFDDPLEWLWARFTDWFLGEE